MYFSRRRSARSGLGARAGKRLGSAALLLSVALGSGVSAPGCSSKPAGDVSLGETGTVGLNLQLSPDVIVNAISYSITGNGFSKTGTLDVEGATRVSGTIGGIPEGDGYILTLTATSTDGKTTCAGSASFDVTAGATTGVTIHLQCRGERGTGSVTVEGTINVCPVVDELTVGPLTAYVGSKVKLAARGSDVDEGPESLSYEWTTSGGELDGSDAANATLTSETAGSRTVTLTVSDGDCTDSVTTVVEFVEREPDGNGGRSGSGNDAGSSGSGTTAGSGTEPGTGGSGTTAGTGGDTGSSGSGTSAGTGGDPGSSGSGTTAGSGNESGSGGSSTEPGTGGSDTTAGTGGGTEPGGGTGGSSEPSAGSGGEAGSSPVALNSLELVTTAVTPSKANTTSAVLNVPEGLQPGDLAVAIVLTTGTVSLGSQPAGFTTLNLAASNHRLSYGTVGTATSLTWSITATATTGITAYFFRGQGISVKAVSSTSTTSLNYGRPEIAASAGTDASLGYALFGLQLGITNPPTIASGPGGSWVGPLTDGRQLYTWSQPLGESASGSFVFPASVGTLSASTTFRSAQVLVSAPKLLRGD